ncbi:MAG: dihydropteroate synthase [Dehalococcoidia bacterium]
MSVRPLSPLLLNPHRTTARETPMQIGSAEFRWGARTYLMGVINVTPDSFSGDGFYLDVAAAVARGIQLERDGADLIDIGGESTRPGHRRVALDEELRRVVPVIEELAKQVHVPISVDTSKAAVAEAAVRAGAALVNDVTGLMGDSRMSGAVRELDVPVILMARGASRVGDVIERVGADLLTSFNRAEAAGLDIRRVLMDPGFGFGKTWRENLELLRRLPEIEGSGLPLVVGLSRKSTIAKVLGPDRQFGAAPNAALTALAVAAGADVVRVHDVTAMRAAARIADAVVRH